MKVSLTDICDFQGGTQPPKDEWIDQPAQGYVRMLQIRDFTQSDKNYIEYVKDTGKLKTCIEDDILIGRYGASIGKILTGLAGAYNVAIVKTIPDEKVVSKKYLYWYLNSQYFQRFISNVGSRAAQAGFNKNDLGAAQIPLVDKERQEEICEVLEKANKLISLRKQQLAKLDELVKARFVEMFGDHKSDLYNWTHSTIGECCVLKSGTSLPADRENEGGNIPYIKVGDMNIARNRQYITTSSRFVTEQTAGNGIFPVGTVIFPKRGGAIGTNKKRLTVRPICADLNIMGVTAGKQLVSQYLMAYFSMIDLGKLNNGSSVPQINNKDIAPLPINLPPIKLQNQFSDFVERVDQQKQTVQQSLEKLELMKKALMQEYFG